ncbi:hypothetical protein [Paenibacillus polymyxa]
MNKLKTEDLVKEAIDYLLEAELTEENGWTEDHIELLKKISREEFEIVFK